MYNLFHSNFLLNMKDYFVGKCSMINKESHHKNYLVEPSDVSMIIP